MRTCITEAGDCVRMNEHFPDDIKIAIVKVRTKQDRKILPLIAHEKIIHELLVCLASGFGALAKASVFGRLVVDRQIQLIQERRGTFEDQIGIGHHPALFRGHIPIRQYCSPHFGLLQFSQSLRKMKACKLLICLAALEHMIGSNIGD